MHVLLLLVFVLLIFDWTRPPSASYSGYVPEWVIQEGESSTKGTDGYASPRFLDQGESDLYYGSETSPERTGMPEEGGGGGGDALSSTMCICCNDFDAANETEMSVQVGDR